MSRITAVSDVVHPSVCVCGFESFAHKQIRNRKGIHCDFSQGAESVCNSERHRVSDTYFSVVLGSFRFGFAQTISLVVVPRFLPSYTGNVFY